MNAALEVDENVFVVDVLNVWNKSDTNGRVIIVGGGNDQQQ